MSTPPRGLSVLFLCTRNSARSIIAESMLNSEGKGRFKAYSAGSHPSGYVNPFALEYLRQHRLDTRGLSSKDWQEFVRPGAPPLDFVITVCDSAAGEVCPVWPGQPVTAHWGIADPAAVSGTDDEKRKAVSEAAEILLNRIRAFISLRLDKLDRRSLQNVLREISKAT